MARLGSEACDLLHGLLAYDPARRITAAQALRHPWFRDARLPAQALPGPAPPPLPLAADPCRTTAGGPPAGAHSFAASESVGAPAATAMFP